VTTELGDCTVPFHVVAISIAVTGEALTNVAREEFCAVPNWYEQRTKARKSRVAVCRSIGTSIGSPVINQAIEENLLCDSQSRVKCQQTGIRATDSHASLSLFRQTLGLYRNCPKKGTPHRNLVSGPVTIES
jgi:hypothetical protein